MTLHQALFSLGRPLVVVVTGGRDYADQARVAWALDGLVTHYGISILHAGDAKGADTLALRWADAHGVPKKKHEADWDTHGRAAGPIRNRAMLREATPDLVVAFPGGSGTKDCVSAAKGFGFRVWSISPE